EGIERKGPGRVGSGALRTASGGAGKYRGGLGIDMRVRNLVEGKWNFELVKRNQCPPWGLWGGEAGEYGMYLLREPEEHEFRAARGVHRPVPVGSEVIVRTGGGGGGGAPPRGGPGAVRRGVRGACVATRAGRGGE